MLMINIAWKAEMTYLFLLVNEDHSLFAFYAHEEHIYL